MPNASSNGGIENSHKEVVGMGIVKIAGTIIIATVFCLPLALAATSHECPCRQSNKTTCLKSFEVFGTVRFLKLEGGLWGIVGDNGESYEPTDLLPKKLRRDGLRVKFVFEEVEQVPSNRMWGKQVKIVGYKIVKKPTNK